MARKNKQLVPLLTMAVAFMLWGLNAPFIKIALDSVPVLSLIAIKYCFGALIFMAFALRRWRKMPSGVWLRVIVATISGYALASFFFYEGIKLTGALNASLIYLAAPLLLYFLSVEVLKERFNTKLLTGVIAGLLGTFLIIGAPIFSQGYAGSASLFGVALILAAVVTDVIGAIMIKPVLKKIPPLQTTAVRFAIAATIFAPFLILQSPQLMTVSITPELIIAVGYNLIFATLIAFLLYHWALSKISSEQSSPFYYLDPMFGAVGSMIILGEQITTFALTGIILIVIGLYFSEGRSPRLKLHLSHHR